MARALGLSLGRINAMVAQGMPLTTPAAAQAWRANHVRLTLRMERAKAPDACKQAREVSALGARAADLLKVNEFHLIERELRAALRAVPERRRDEIVLEWSVWDALTEEFSDFFYDRESPIDPANSNADEAEDSALTQRLLYAIAAGDDAEFKAAIEAVVASIDD